MLRGKTPVSRKTASLYRSLTLCILICGLLLNPLNCYGAAGVGARATRPATNQPPVANAGGPYAGTAGTAVQFNGSNSTDPDGSIASYQWVFGDGTSGSGASPTHVYAAAGTYNVSLTVTDDGGATHSAGVVANVTSPGQITYQYDEAGRLVSVTDQAGNTGTYTYDSVGNLVSAAGLNPAQVTISRFAPAAGGVGATVTIHGSGFSPTPGQNSVSFNGTGASVLSSTPTRLVVVVPTGATTGPVTATSPAGTATSVVPFTVEGVAGAPTITDFSPRMGLAGTPVNVTGTNFDADPANNNVKINTIFNTVTSAAPAALSLKVAARATSGRLSVTTPGGAAVGEDFFVPPAPHLPTDVEYTGRTGLGQQKMILFERPNTVGLLLFDGVKGRRISLVRETDPTAPLLATEKIYDPEGRLLASGGDFIDAHTLPLTGTYTVLLDPSGDDVGRLHITIHDVPPDVDEEIAAGHFINVPITTPGQNGKLTFNGTSGQKFYVMMEDTTIEEGTVSLKRTNQTIVFRHIPPPVYPPGVTVLYRYFALEPPVGSGTVLAADGPYEIFIDPYKAKVGNVKVTLFLMPPDPSYPIAIDGPPVQVTSVPYDPPPPPPPGERYEAQPPPNGPGTNWWLVFDGTAGQRVTIQAAGVTIGKSDLTVVKPGGSELASTTVNTSGKTFGPLELPVTGTYKILIDPHEKNTGTMSVRVYGIPDVTGTIAPGDPPLTKTTTLAGQYIRLTFEGTAGQQVNLNVTNVSFSPTVLYTRDYTCLHKPDGATMVCADVNSGSAFINTQTLPATGTYTILHKPQSVATGSMTFALSEVIGDVTGEITPGGPPVTKTTTVSGQNVALSFDAAAGQKVSLETSYSQMSGTISLRRPDGSVVVSQGSSGVGSFVDTQTLSAAGRYTIYYDVTGANVGSVTFKLHDVVDVTGPIVAGGQPVSASLNTPGQRAALTFSGTAGQRVSLNLTGGTFPFVAYANVYVTIRKPDGTTLVSADINGSTQKFVDPVTLPVAGTYTVVCDPPGTRSGGVTFALYDVADVTGAVSVGGPAVTASTSVPGQNILLTFEGTAGQKISITKTGVGSTTLKYPDGTSSATNASITGKVLTATGTYTIVIDPTDASTGSATVTVHLVSDITGEIVTGGPPVSAAFNVPGRDMALTFAGTAGQRVSLNVTAANFSFLAYQNVYVYLRAPDGTNVATADINGSTQKFVEPVTLPATGTYTLVCDPPGTRTGAATFALYDVVDVSGPVTPGGAAVPVTFAAPGQNAALTFNGEAGQQVTVRLTGNTAGSVAVKLLRPDGTTQVTQTSSAAGFNLTTQTLPSAGVYTISLNPSGTATGSINVTLTNP